MVKPNCVKIYDINIMFLGHSRPDACLLSFAYYPMAVLSLMDVIL